MTGNMDRTSVYYIVDDFFGCGWYRCHVPGMELKRRGYTVALDDTIDPPTVEAFDVIVFQRQWRPQAVQAMEYARSLGKMVVYELDDDLWNLHESNPAYDAWTDPAVVGNAEAMLRRADLVTTTTPSLARTLRRFNSNVRILPNMLPAEHWQVRRERPADDDTVVLGWAGSAQRWRDISLVKEVVRQLLDRYPNVEMVIATGDSSNMVFGEHPRVKRIGPVQIEEYAHLLTPFDIGLAPIVDSRFNQAKSDLKYIEYSMLGIPTVASHVEAYVHTIVNGDNGFLAKNDKDWLKYLQRLIEKPELRAEMGAKAKAVAESRSIANNVGLWERAYDLAAEPGVEEQAAS